MGNATKSLPRYTDLEGYCNAHPELKKQSIALQLEIDPARFSKLKSRKYGVRPTEIEAQRIAALLNQPVNHVLRLYERAA